MKLSVTVLDALVKLRATVKLSVTVLDAVAKPRVTVKLLLTVLDAVATPGGQCGQGSERGAVRPTLGGRVGRWSRLTVVSGLSGRMSRGWCVWRRLQAPWPPL